MSATIPARDPVPLPPAQAPSQQIGGPGGYVKRKIELSIKLGMGDYGMSGFNTITLKGLRVSCSIQKYGEPNSDTADFRVFGMNLDLMNKLSSLGKPIYRERLNTITVSAGDDVVGMSIVFFGIIMEAWADMAGQPEVSFNITAQTGALNSSRPVAPFSYNGSADASTIMGNIASQMINADGKLGMKFENNGVSVILDHPYFPGTLKAQAEACARAAHINWAMDGDTLAIWPIDGKRNAGVPLLTARAGLVGYPAFVVGGIGVRSVFNPAIVFGGQVKVESIIKPANGTWTIYRLFHTLESEQPNGAWFTDFEGYDINAGNPKLAGQQ